MERWACEYRYEKRLVRALIIPTVLYGCETWTMTKKMRKKINACEMWIWRKMLRISWMEKRANEWVRIDIGIENNDSLQQTVLTRKLGFFGHVMRSNGLEKDMMLAYEEGRRKQGRPRKRWLDEVQETTGMNLEQLREATSERKQWRRLIMTIARVQRTGSTR